MNRIRSTEADDGPDACPSQRGTVTFVGFSRSRLPLLGGRSTVGHVALDHVIGVRIPASQPSSYPGSAHRRVLLLNKSERRQDCRSRVTFFEAMSIGSGPRKCWLDTWRLLLFHGRSARSPMPFQVVSTPAISSRAALRERHRCQRPSCHTTPRLRRAWLCIPRSLGTLASSVLVVCFGRDRNVGFQSIDVRN